VIDGHVMPGASMWPPQPLLIDLGRRWWRWRWKQIHHGLKSWELNRSFTIFTTFFLKKTGCWFAVFVHLSEFCVIECVDWLCRMGWIILYIDILAIYYTCYILCRNERTFIYKQCWTWRCWNHVSIGPPKKSGYQQILNLNRYPPGIKHGSWNLLNIFSS